MSRIRIREPRKDGTPRWVQESWVGVMIELPQPQESGEDYVVSLDDALMALRQSDQNAAWFWFTCMVAKNGPTLTFPRAICELVEPVYPAYVGRGGD